MFPTSYFPGSYFTKRYWPPAAEEDEPPPFNPSTGDGLTSIPIRRVRQAPYMAHEQKRTVYTRFQLDLQAGMGLSSGQGSNPVVSLAWSDNGARTWSNEYPIELGAMGNYKQRAIWRRLGQSRHRVFRITVSDPVDWVLLDAFLEVIAGTE